MTLRAVRQVLDQDQDQPARRQREQEGQTGSSDGMGMGMGMGSRSSAESDSKECVSAAESDGVTNGISARFLSLGGIIQRFSVDHGRHELVQRFDSADDYRRLNVPYFGETIGRVANRIAHARIQALNGGRSYALDANDGSNCLHGGFHGWGKRAWRRAWQHREARAGAQDASAGSVSVKYVLASRDGDGGFPGAVDAAIVYTDGVEVGSDGASVSVLQIEYEAELVFGSDETVVAMTNHSYFNLAGANTAANIAGTQVTLATNLHLPVDAQNIPTGAIEPFPGIAAERSFVLGAVEPDIDHCFVHDTNAQGIPTDTRSRPLRKLASFYHPDSRVHLEVHSTEPAFQFYTGKYIDVPAAGSVPTRGVRTGFCVEPCRYINAVNVDEWKGMVVLRRGEKYGSRIVYRAWKDAGVP